MTVYIDVLFIINLIINYFIALAVASLLQINCKRLRIFAGAVFGALYAVFIFFPELNFMYTAVSKLLASAVIIFISFKIHSLKHFIVLLFNFYLISMLFGGAMYAIQYFLAPPVLNVRNGVTYMDISPMLLILTSAGCYIAIHLFSKFFHRNVHTDDIYETEIYLNGTAAAMDALLDNGNDLCDSLTGAPVIIAEYSKIEKLIPKSLRHCYKTGVMADPSVLEAAGFNKRFRVIPYKSVGSAGGVLPAFRPDKLVVKGADIECTDVLVAVSDHKFSDDDSFSALLNPRIFRKAVPQIQKAAKSQK